MKCVGQQVSGNMELLGRLPPNVRETGMHRNKEFEQLVSSVHNILVYGYTNEYPNHKGLKGIAKELQTHIDELHPYLISKAAINLACEMFLTRVVAHMGVAYFFDEAKAHEIIAVANTMKEAARSGNSVSKRDMNDILTKLKIIEEARANGYADVFPTATKNMPHAIRHIVNHVKYSLTNVAAIAQPLELQAEAETDEDAITELKEYFDLESFVKKAAYKIYAALPKQATRPLLVFTYLPQWNNISSECAISLLHMLYYILHPNSVLFCLGAAGKEPRYLPTHRTLNKFVAVLHDLNRSIYRHRDEGLSPKVLKATVNELKTKYNINDAVWINLGRNSHKVLEPSLQEVITTFNLTSSTSLQEEIVKLGAKICQQYSQKSLEI